MKKPKQYPIDIVIPWVDSTDPDWIKDRNKYALQEGISSVIDNSDERFRDWDTLKYLFRGIEKYASWVRTIHFITYGHLPHWMNTKASKLHIVKHSDYMPERYLPTFSSHTIELNMHKINGLAEHFIYFNDDILILKFTKPTDFFEKGIPRDYAILNPAISSHRNSVLDTAISNIEIINDHFSKNQVIKKNFFKWFNVKYKINNLKTLCLMPWPKFAHMYGRHLCNPFLKSTFEKVWSKESEILETTSMHKFRTRRDVNQWLMRAWQLAEGNFIPISPEYGKYYRLVNDNSELLKALNASKYKIICVNDTGIEDIINFEKNRYELLSVLEVKFPERSSFER